MSRLAISSWSLDGSLQAGMLLEEVPAQMVHHGIGTLELCHFHLPSTDDEYLAHLRKAIETAGIELYSLLIDTGDIVAPDDEARTADIATIESYFPIAKALGAQQVRISAGRQSATPIVLADSAEQLARFAHTAREVGLRTITENWQLTSEQPGDLLQILERCEGAVGLCADTGNAEATADKYETLAHLLPHATSVHYKARYTSDGSVDLADRDRCVALIREACFDGVITLIYADKHDEWAGIDRLREAMQVAL